MMARFAGFTLVLFFITNAVHAQEGNFETGCPPGYYKCIYNLHCIDERLICNGHHECRSKCEEAYEDWKGCEEDSGDEDHCEVIPLDKRIECENGMDGNWFNNMIKEIPDAYTCHYFNCVWEPSTSTCFRRRSESDDIEEDTTKEAARIWCPQGHYDCKFNSHCIDESLLCNGLYECRSKCEEAYEGYKGCEVDSGDEDHCEVIPLDKRIECDNGMDSKWFNTKISDANTCHYFNCVWELSTSTCFRRRSEGEAIEEDSTSLKRIYDFLFEQQNNGSTDTEEDTDGGLKDTTEEATNSGLKDTDEDQSCIIKSDLIACIIALTLAILAV